MGSINPNTIRICTKCGCEYHPTSSRQKCCNKPITSYCVVCNKPMQSLCTFTPQKETCSDECAAILANVRREKNVSSKIMKCQWCGEDFTPKSAKDVYCRNKHYKTCSVCGSKFEIDVRKDPTVKTCSDECRYILAKQNTDNDKMVEALKATLNKKYGVDNAMQIAGTQDKIKATNLIKYGAEYYTQTDAYKQSVLNTSLNKYGVEHYLKSNEVIAKREATVKERYGSNNIFSSEYGKHQVKTKMLEKYGVTNPSQNKETKRKATSSARTSKLEERICNMLDDYRINYHHHYFVSANGHSHEFDFLLIDYNILIDADGLYFHSYLDDPDGVRVRDDYDEVRVNLVPEGYRFILIVEGQEDTQIRDLVHQLNDNGIDLTKWDSQLFDWCRSIEFPYPSYTLDRMISDWNHLCSYNISDYNPHSRLGESLIKHHHKSIYSAHVGNSVSLEEAWNNDDMLKKAIANRHIYKNNIDPSKVLAGLYISKLCPKISIFNPVLARYLTNKYLSVFDTVFDPFSGYSGRMLGVCSLNKIYIGHDINNKSIEETHQIVSLLKNNNYKINAHVTYQDATYPDTNHYDCLLTCPPYSDKETYNNEQVYKTCSDWITTCLNNFTCSRYVFVVDDPGQYKDKVVETLQSSSHLNKVTEYVIVIDK